MKNVIPAKAGIQFCSDYIETDFRWNYHETTFTNKNHEKSHTSESWNPVL